jgi:hypothetical protein
MKNSRSSISSSTNKTLVVWSATAIFVPNVFTYSKYLKFSFFITGECRWRDFFITDANQCQMKTSRSEILKELSFSKDRGNAVGIRLKGSQKTILTAVENIFVSDSCSRVMLKPFCIYGEELTKKELMLNEIEAVMRLRIRFEDPFYANLRNIKNNIQRIKINIIQLKDRDRSF